MGPKEKQDVTLKAYLDGVPVSIGEITEITLDDITPDMLLRNFSIQEVQKAVINGYKACTVRYIPERILKSGNRTIVFWLDGTKTIVKRSKSEPDDTYAAFTAALGIKLFGSNSALKKIINGKTEFQKTKDGEYV